jgi:polysaccharide export outer membrane protein
MKPSSAVNVTGTLGTIAVICLGILTSTASAVESPPYILGPDDQITIRAMDADEISEKPVTIDSTGFLNLPMIGRIRATGMTVKELESHLAERLKEYVWNPRVAVTISGYHSQPVSVIGAVNIPGIQQLRGRKTLVEVLSLSGGLRPDAGNMVAVRRSLEHGPIPLPQARTDASGKFSLAEVSLRSMMHNSQPEDNIVIQPNDVISVPRAQLVYVVGEVKKAGGFPIQERETISILQALALAEGLLPTASPGAARILRPDPAGERKEIVVDLNKTLGGKSPDVQLRPDDILFVPNSMSKKAFIRGMEAAIQLGTGIVIWRR